jgi:pilus assembly protein CpaF
MTPSRAVDGGHAEVLPDGPAARRLRSIDATVDAVCQRVIDQPGELGPLVERAVRALLPLAGDAERDDVAARACARLDGLGDLAPFVTDPRVDEVLVNNGHDIWVECAGQLTHVGRLTSHSVEHLVERILAPIGRRLDRSSPIVDARLHDGSRMCAVIPPVAVDGPILSIRRFAPRSRSLHEFTDGVGTALLAELIEARCNVVVSGATSSGKTSLLSSVLATIPTDDRIVVIEDTAELAIHGHHVARLEARQPTIDGPRPIALDELVRTALRLRPDRLVVGEIRGAEVLAMVQAMNTGHDGSWSTVHANSADDAVLRLESLVVGAAPSWPLAAIREQLRRSIDVVVHVERTGTGRRRITEIGEVVALDGVASDDPPGSRSPRPADLTTVPIRPTTPIVTLDQDAALRRVRQLTRGRR